MWNPQKIKPFAGSCGSTVFSLWGSTATLKASGKLHTFKGIAEVIECQRSLMKSMLDDMHLNGLRLEHGIMLARIRKVEGCSRHKLVILSNTSLKQPESLLEIHKFEEGTD